MEKLIGWKLDKFPLKLKFIVDLEYFDGVLLSWFENEEHDNYLYSWCDSDQHCNRWLVFRVSDHSLVSYIEGKVKLQDLILNPIDKFIYVLDLDYNLVITQAYLIQPHNLPDDYIPESESYYSFLELNPETMNQDKQIIQQKLYSLV